MFSALSVYSAPPEPDVQIWSAKLDALTNEDRDRLASYLNVAEQARAARFHFEVDRQRYVVARGLLRHLLGAELRRQPSTLVFEEGAKGKPLLVRDELTVSTLRFNVSHSEGEAMFALVWDREVGIDLEAGARLGRARDLSALAQRVLSKNEMRNWRALPTEAARQSAFLRGWTRKEAYAKARGEGIFDGLAEIEVILDAGAPQPSLTVERWTVHDLCAPPGFAAAIAIEQR